MTPPLHRQQLVRLNADGWRHAQALAADDPVRCCLALWAEHSYPLVVTRQACVAGETLALGLPAPSRFGRRRIALVVQPSHVLFFDEFPAGEAVTPLLTAAVRADWTALLRALGDAGCLPRVYGGYGWECLTGLAYLRESSDIDLLLPVADAAQADAVCDALAASAIAQPRLDGELAFANGDAFAWREWCRYRQGEADAVLVKRLRGVALERPGMEHVAC